MVAAVVVVFFCLSLIRPRARVRPYSSSAVRLGLTLRFSQKDTRASPWPLRRRKQARTIAIRTGRAMDDELAILGIGEEWALEVDSLVARLAGMAEHLRARAVSAVRGPFFRTEAAELEVVGFVREAATDAILMCEHLLQDAMVIFAAITSATHIDEKADAERGTLGRNASGDGGSGGGSASRACRGLDDTNDPCAPRLAGSTHTHVLRLSGCDLRDAGQVVREHGVAYSFRLPASMTVPAGKLTDRYRLG